MQIRLCKLAERVVNYHNFSSKIFRAIRRIEWQKTITDSGPKHVEF